METKEITVDITDGETYHINNTSELEIAIDKLQDILEEYQAKNPHQWENVRTVYEIKKPK